MSDAAKDTIEDNTGEMGEQQGDDVDLQEEAKIKYEQIQRSVQRAIDADREKILSKGYSLRNTKIRLTEVVMRDYLDLRYFNYLSGAVREDVETEVGRQLARLLDADYHLPTPASADAGTQTESSTSNLLDLVATALEGIRVCLSSEFTNATSPLSESSEDDCEGEDYEQNTEVRAFVTVIGGRRVAEKYRAKISLKAERFSLTHVGDVFPVDETRPWRKEESFPIPLSQLRYKYVWLIRF